MSPHVVVREYARLTTAEIKEPSLDLAQISETAFDWLCEQASRFTRAGAQLLQVDGRRCLKLDSHVGVLESPCGQVIEILPKHVDGELHPRHDEVTEARKLLHDLLCSALNLPSRETAEASLQLSQAPLSEWVMRQFLLALDHLLKRGLRFDYERVEEEQKFLHGQLDTTRQLRQPPHKQHVFQIRHDVFVPNRPENRLLKAALDLVLHKAQTPDNWRLAHELAHMLQELPASRQDQVEQDFRAWNNGRLMAHYQPLKPWCELILHRHLPLAVSGDWRGISFLFPMERLFEQHVAHTLRRRLTAGAKLTTQSTRYSLCHYQEQACFQLRPDLLLEHAGQSWVLDTKWKRLDENDKAQRYGLSQADLYQLFAYGQYYQRGEGDMLLIYPRWNGFTKPLPHPFQFQPPLLPHGLRLWAVPFDLKNNNLLLPDCLALAGLC